MRYRYFTALVEGFYLPWTLLPEDEGLRLAQNREATNEYASIEWWDSKEENKSCPIYADFDYVGALEDTRSFVAACEAVLRVVPLIYFSGSKGFHVVVPTSIRDKRCEKFILTLLDSLGTWPSLDRSVYKTRNMWRIVNTKHAKTGLYKISLTLKELYTLSIEEIKQLAANEREILRTNIETINRDYIIEILTKAKEGLKEKEKQMEESAIEASKHRSGNIPPCIYRLINTTPMWGEWHNTLFTLARFFETWGISAEAGIRAILKRPHWAEDEEYVIKTVQRVFQGTGTKTFGCTGNEGLRSKCVPQLCRFYKE